MISRTKGQYMRESNILAGYATMKQQLQREILCGFKVHYIKESNNHSGNATVKQIQQEILCFIKRQYMKESNILESNVTFKQLQREVL